jgi:hypothetical protein
MYCVRVLSNHVNAAECGVTKHGSAATLKDEIRKRIAEANTTHVLHRMIEQEEHIEATAAAPRSHGPRWQ